MTNFVGFGNFRKLSQTLVKICKWSPQFVALFMIICFFFFRFLSFPSFLRVNASKKLEKGTSWKWKMKTPVRYGERRESSPLWPTPLPTFKLSVALSPLFEKAAPRRRICPQIFCGFWPTHLDLKRVTFYASCFCRSWSVEATLDDVAWPKRALRIMPAFSPFLREMLFFRAT